MVLCYKCRHFRGVDVHGYVYCEIYGRTYFMLICKHYQPADQLEGDENERGDR